MVACLTTFSQVSYGSLCWVPEHYLSTIVDPARLMLGATPEMIALPPKESVPDLQSLAARIREGL